MDKLKKFLATLDRKRALRLAEVIVRIQAGLIENLNVKPLKGVRGHFRCRVGDIRILFCRHGKGYLVYDADFRGNIYKK